MVKDKASQLILVRHVDNDVRCSILIIHIKETTINRRYGFALVDIVILSNEHDSTGLIESIDDEKVRGTLGIS